jgi:hypothetical protein
MSFISYAPNFEDVLLWRALRDIEHGYYIDLLPNAAPIGSVTQAFYQLGWRGLNLAASPALARALRIARPADATLDGVAGAREGSAILYEAPDAQLATRDAAQARQYRAEGREVMQRDIALHTLDRLCAEHAGPEITDIHFLHVGADAAEALAGLDLQRWRPWVVIAAGGPQQRLLDHGYALAHEDGMQHYYAAVERPQVLAALRLPPHPADDFQLCQDHPYSHPLAEWRARTAAAEATSEESRTWAMAHVKEWRDKDHLSEGNKLRAEQAVAELATVSAAAAATAAALAGTKSSLTNTEAALAGTQASLAHAEATLANTSAALEATQARALAAESELGVMRQRTAHAEGTLNAVHATLSWRITLPLRIGKLYAGKLVRLPRRIAGRLKRDAARLKRGAIGLVKRVLRYAVRYVTARPRLSFLVRRTAARFPALVQLLRRVQMQSQAQAIDVVQAPPPTELQHLPDAARQVYEDLRRTRLTVPRR